MTPSRQSFLAAGQKFILQSLDIKSSVASLVRFAAATSGSDMGSLYLLDPADRLLKPYVIINLPERFTQGCETVALGTQCCGRTALHKRPWVVHDMWSDPLFIDCREAAMASGIRAGFSVPVMDKDTGACLGTLASHFYEVYRPDERTLDSFYLLAELIAFALQKAPQPTAQSASSFA